MRKINPEYERWMEEELMCINTALTPLILQRVVVLQTSHDVWIRLKRLHLIQSRSLQLKHVHILSYRTSPCVFLGYGRNQMVDPPPSSTNAQSQAILLRLRMPISLCLFPQIACKHILSPAFSSLKLSFPLNIPYK